MANPVSFSSVNPLAGVNLGGMGSMGSILLVIFLAIAIIGLVGGLIFWKSVKKAYWIKIHVFRLMGNVPTRVAIYSGREIPFGMAGDKLWKVASAGFNKLKAIKWLPVGKIQTAPAEFWYYIRDDGEWINFCLSDLSEISKKAGVRFVQEDMRLQRLATERLLEQRLMNKSFWEKWGTVVMTIIVFLVVAICMAIIFYQWGKLIDKMQPLVDMLTRSLQRVEGSCGYFNYSSGGSSGLIPAR